MKGLGRRTAVGSPLKIPAWFIDHADLMKTISSLPCQTRGMGANLPIKNDPRREAWQLYAIPGKF